MGVSPPLPLFIMSTFGTPRTEKDEALLAQIATIEEKLGYKICGARNRELKPCTNKAGKGTDHLGEGRCKYHGGRNQTPSSKNWKHGFTAQLKTQHPKLREVMERLSADHDVFDLRDEILKIRAIMEIQSEVEDWSTVAKLAVDVSKVIERLHNIEVGRRYVISIDNVSVIIQAVQEAIFRHVPDEITRHLIAEELTSIKISGALPPAKVIDAEYKEIVDEKRD